ncbi:MAG: UDP-glucose:sterol glucosyltransferase, partial [uncultured Thermomicrobiales bacterium]
ERKADRPHDLRLAGRPPPVPCPRARSPGSGPRSGRRHERRLPGAGRGARCPLPSRATGPARSGGRAGPGAPPDGPPQGDRADRPRAGDAVVAGELRRSPGGERGGRPPRLPPADLRRAPAGGDDRDRLGLLDAGPDRLLLRARPAGGPQRRLPLPAEPAWAGVLAGRLLGRPVVGVPLDRDVAGAAASARVAAGARSDLRGRERPGPGPGPLLGGTCHEAGRLAAPDARHRLPVPRPGRRGASAACARPFSWRGSGAGRLHARLGGGTGRRRLLPLQPGGGGPARSTGGALDRVRPPEPTADAAGPRHRGRVRPLPRALSAGRGDRPPGGRRHDRLGDAGRPPDAGRALRPRSARQRGPGRPRRHRPGRRPEPLHPVPRRRRARPAPRRPGVCPPCRRDRPPRPGRGGCPRRLRRHRGRPPGRAVRRPLGEGIWPV